MANTPTPHNGAKLGEIAKTVLMPGDPLRAKFIAENFLENPKLVNKIRNMYCYTGTYEGKEVSVMGSGMGMPSIGLYSYELYNFYDVDQIIRIGSAGGYADGLQLYDIVIGQAAATNSSYFNYLKVPGTPALCGDYELIEKSVAYAKANNLRYRVGPILSSDVFYGDPDAAPKWKQMGILAVEMEAAALYTNAIQAGKKALAILTISDIVLGGTPVETTAEERETKFTDMMKMALSLA